MSKYTPNLFLIGSAEGVLFDFGRMAFSGNAIKYLLGLTSPV